MKIDRIALHGVYDVFPGTVDLSLRDAPPGVYAFVGPNGVGKTSTMEIVPAVLFRQCPSRDNDDPVTYALGRDSWMETEFTIAGVGTFRARLNLDGPKRKTDAVLEALGADGARVALNDGKCSTYDAAIRERFPSLNLFVNTAFAPQGLGGRLWSYGKPADRKDLFLEALALGRYPVLAKAAADAADLCADSKLRLTAQVESLQKDTAAGILEELDRLAKDLQTKGGDAEVRQIELADRITDLETRVALVADQAAAYAAAQQAVRTAETALAQRQTERTAIERARAKAAADGLAEEAGIRARLAETLTDIASRIAGNEQIREQAADIRAAVTAIAAIDERLPTLREHERQQQAHVDVVVVEHRKAELALQAFIGPQKDLARAKTDASLLGTVPCGGAGEYAACSFLKNATEASGRIAELEATVATMTDAIAHRDQAVTRHGELTAALAQMRRDIGAVVTQRLHHESKAKYEKPLLEAETRIAELETKRRDAEADATRQTDAVQQRRVSRDAEFSEQLAALDETIASLERDLATARHGLGSVAAGNAAAVQLQAELVAARGDRDTVIATLATVESGRAELERRRADLQAKRARLVDIKGRIARVDQEYLEWRDLAKALGKGGLPDLDIDAAGISISALTNVLLRETYGPQFSVELVTQVPKSDGSGMKDEFTARVFNNAANGGWRDIRQLSGGQKVIVQEALMLAISLYVNERAALPIKTLWRDESGAALDGENAVRYVQMLRKAREMGGFVHVFFVSHTPAAAALADAQIQVGDGQARLVFPPYGEAAA